MPRKVFRKVRRSRTNVKKIVRKELSKAIETKEATFDFSTMGLNSIGTGGATTAPLFGHLANIPTGTLDGQRVGNQIILRGLRYYFPIQNAVGDRINHVRLCYVMPKRYYPVSGTITEFLRDCFGDSAWNMYSPINTDKYTVYVDRMIYLRNVANDGSSANANPDTKLLKGFFKINKKIQYDFEGITQVIRPDQELYCFAISDSTAIPNAGAIGGFSRVFYKDA